jgi:hypothetical protein
LRLSEPDRAEEQLAALLDKTGKPRAPRQYEVLELLHKTRLEMSVSDVLAFIPNAQGAIRALIQKGYLSRAGM